MTTTYNTGIVGLGSIGFGMATSLVKAGIDTWGFDINQDQLTNFEQNGGKTGNLLEIAPTLDCLILVVVNAAQTESILMQPDLLNALKEGAVVVSCATVPPEFAKTMEANCHNEGLHYLDAPTVSYTHLTLPTKT